jgi:orotate phosphoribosyltransferase
VTDSEARLLQLLKERSFRRGTFRLASGETSTYYIDGRMTAVFSGAVPLIGEVLYERTRGLGITAIGGLAVGAVPLTTAAVYAYSLHGESMEGFWVRDEVKGHGTQKLIEGNLRPGSRVAVVDDVFTKGNSAATAVKAVRRPAARSSPSWRWSIGCAGPRSSSGVWGWTTTRLFSRSGISGWRRTSAAHLKAPLAKGSLASDNLKDAVYFESCGAHSAHLPPAAGNRRIIRCFPNTAEGRG